MTKQIIISLLGLATVAMLISQKDKSTVKPTNFYVLDSNKHTICSVYVSPIGQVNIPSKKNQVAYLSASKDSSEILMKFNLKSGNHEYLFNESNSIHTETAHLKKLSHAKYRSKSPSISMSMSEFESDDVMSIHEDKMTIEPAASKTDGLAITTAPKSGVITAGIWNDLENWEQYYKTYPNTYSFWGIDFNEKRFSVEILNPDKSPAIGLKLALKNKLGNIVWQTQTDNRGYAELWCNIFSAEKLDESNDFELFEKRGDGYRSIGKLKGTGFARSTFYLRASKTLTKKVDICFTVDATGSMGDEINHLKQDLMYIIQGLRKASPCAEIRVGSVFYRDASDEYLTRKFDFTPYPENAMMFIGNQNAGGGGDFPEAVDAGLKVANEDMNWTEDGIAKINFLILDAPPHVEAQQNIQKQIKIAAEKGIKIIPITASGIDASTEILMKQLAVATNGDYIYITDHSGVGSSHLKPTGVKENVDLLTNQMIKILAKYCSIPDCDIQNDVNVPIQNPNIVNFGNKDIIVQCFPNPATDYLDFDADYNIDEIIISTFNGVKILNVSPNEKKYRLRLPDVIPGIYIVNVKINQSNFTTKVVISNSKNQN